MFDRFLRAKKEAQIFGEAVMSFPKNSEKGARDYEESCRCRRHWRQGEEATPL
jgi:hypothetical protein